MLCPDTYQKQSLVIGWVGILCWLVVVGWWLLVGGCWLVVVGWWLLVGGCWLVVVGWLLFVGCCLGRAKHSGNSFFVFSDRLLARMLCPYRIN